MGHGCQPRWSQAWETASLAQRGNARLHSTLSSKTGDQQEDVVAHISPHVFYVAHGQRGGCKGCTGAVAALNSKDDVGHLHAGLSPQKRAAQSKVVGMI